MLEGSRNSIEVTAGMTCSHCEPWAARTRRRLERRRRKLEAYGRFSQADPCPECGETDWATTERFIDPRPWWTKWARWPEARQQKQSA
jgi:hypothetical protein